MFDMMFVDRVGHDLTEKDGRYVVVDTCSVERGMYETAIGEIHISRIFDDYCCELDTFLALIGCPEDAYPDEFLKTLPKEEIEQKKAEYMLSSDFLELLEEIYEDYVLGYEVVETYGRSRKRAEKGHNKWVG